MEKIALIATIFLILLILILYPLALNYEAHKCQGEFVKTRIYPPTYECIESQTNE